jgi:hypothetical protein
MPLFQAQNKLGPSNVIPLDLKRYSQGIGLLVTELEHWYTVEITGDNVQKQGYTPASGHWNAHDSLTGLD